MIDCFKISKFQAIDENIPCISMRIYNLLDKPKNIDQLFTQYSQKHHIELSFNLERLLYLALTFLYALDMVDTSEDLVRRII